MEQESFDLGFVGNPDRLNILVACLNSHDFDTVASLARSPPLACLPGAIDLQLSELEFLANGPASATRRWEASLTARSADQSSSLTLLSDESDALKRVAGAIQQSQAF